MERLFCASSAGRRANAGKRRGLKASGFTLIELLVVIAIIAILAAILFPVFAQARENARRTSCLSNVKQIGLGVMQYNQDYDGTYPMNQYFVGNNPNYQVVWANSILPYIKSGNIWGEGGIYRCPSFPHPTQNFNYGVNSSMSTDGDASWNGWKGGGVAAESGLRAPAETVYIIEKGQNNFSWSFGQFCAEEWCWGTWGYGGPNPPSGATGPQTDLQWDYDMPVDNDWGKFTWPGPGVMPRYRHLSTSNALFADGHAKSMRKGSLNWYRNIYPGATGIWPTNENWYPY